MTGRQVILSKNVGGAHKEKEALRNCGCLFWTIGKKVRGNRGSKRLSCDNLPGGYLLDRGECCLIVHKYGVSSSGKGSSVII